MKLYELIDFVPKLSKHSALDNKDRLRKNTKADQIGNGSFGTAFDTKSNKRLNQVTKIGKTGSIMSGNIAKKVEEDGWLLWMQAVHRAQKRGEDNPYFPIMDDLHIRKDKDGLLSYTANLHKLLPFRTAKLISNMDLMVSLREHMFGPTDITFSDGPDAANNILFHLNQTSSAVDRNLAAALNMVDQLIYTSREEFMKDIHYGNVMWRITGTMPQLVIVDPIA
jgi:hypothetical protein